MPVRILILSLVLSSPTSYALEQPAAQGSLLKGVVILNEVGGAPVVGVSVSADGANDTATVAGGKFQLLFPGKKRGHR